MKSKPCIIFDMDGTLIDSSEAMTHSVNFVRNTLGLEPIEKSYLEYHINQPDHHLPKIFYNTEVYDPTHRELFRKNYMNTSSRMISLYPYVREMLEAIRQRAVLSIATNASDFIAKDMLKNLCIEEYFSHVIGANITAPKPNPEMLQTIIKLTNSDEKKTMMIGDSIKDEIAANEAKVSFIFADWGYGTSDTALLRAKNIQELLEKLLKYL